MHPSPPLILSDPNILLGKPTIAGTRITVELILEKLATGESIEQILESHPRLTRESIYAAIAFAAEALRADVVYPIANTNLVNFVADESLPKAEIVTQAIEQHLEELMHSFTVIQPNVVRIR